MKYQVNIVLYPELHKSLNGAFFEKLMRNIFNEQGYNIVQNINYTGLEIDLLGKHKSREETLLVECKAKKKVRNIEIMKFYYNLLISKKADYGYFVYTEELDHQAATMKENHEKTDGKVSTFFGPKKIIDSLVNSGRIKSFNFSIFDRTINIEKLILTYTYYGIHYIAMTFKGTEKPQFHVFNAETLESISWDYRNESDVQIVSQLVHDLSFLNDSEHHEIINNEFMLINNEKHIDISNSFTKYLNSTDSSFAHSKVDEISLSDLYVIPNIQKLNFENLSKRKFENVIGLDTTIEEKSEIKLAFFGDDVSGKTATCKYIFREYFNLNYIPILFSGKDIKGNYRRDKITKIVKNKYKKQYHTNYSIEEHEKDSIIIIIDDFHLSTNGNSKMWVPFLSNVEKEYKNVVLTGDFTTLLKVGLKTSKGETKTLFENFEINQIVEFGPKLRFQLIEKWYSLGNEHNGNDWTNDTLIKLEEYRKHIKTIIGKNYVPAYPFYILSGLQALELNPVEKKKYSVYGFYYELLIKNAMQNAIANPEYFGIYMNYLSYLAYYFFEANTKSISHEEFREFHKKFSSVWDVSFHIETVKKFLISSKLVNIEGNNIFFREKYAYFYFVANYLSNGITKTDESESTKTIIYKIIQRVYRDEYASIIMFLTHLSKDDYIINTLLACAKTNFEDFTASKLEEDVKHINQMISEVPNQVLELVNIKEKRAEKLENEDENERNDNINTIENDTTDENVKKNMIDEDIDAIDYFAKLTRAFKMLDLLGHLGKAYWGQLRKNEKDVLINETYNLGLRALSSYINLMQNATEEIAEHVHDIVSQKKTSSQYELKKQISENTKNFIFRLSYLISYAVIRRISDAVGTDKLASTYKNVLENNQNTATKLITLSIELGYKSRIPMDNIKDYSKSFQKNNLAKVILRQIVINHLYMYDTSITEKQKICSILGIKIADQRKIDHKSKIKKLG